MATFNETGSAGAVCGGVGKITPFIEVGSGGAIGGGVTYNTAPAHPVRVRPIITFRVNLDYTVAVGTPSTPYSAATLGLNTVCIPGVGRLKHGDQFVLDGSDANYVYRKYRTLGRSSGDPRPTLDIISIE